MWPNPQETAETLWDLKVTHEIAWGITKDQDRSINYFIFGSLFTILKQGFSQGAHKTLFLIRKGGLHK